MFIEFWVLLIAIWFVAGIIYRERQFQQAAVSRAIKYNKLVEAMQSEYGGYAFSSFASKYNLSHFCDESINRGKFGTLLGW